MVKLFSSKKTKGEVDYLTAIKTADAAGLEMMYKELFPMVLSIVRKEERERMAVAKDLFQDTTLVIYQKAQKPDFKLTSAFTTFFYGVCENIYNNRLQKKSSLEVTIPEDAKLIADTAPDLLTLERGKLFYKALKILGKDCQKLLELFFQEYSMKEIAEKMGYASDNYASTRKLHCKNKLIEIIKQQPEFKELERD